MFSTLRDMHEKHKRLVLLGLMALSLAPLPLVLVHHEDPTAKQAALWLSAVTGYFGLVLMLWEYILGVKSVFGLWFQDLAPVLQIHKWLGKYGTLLVFLHPILITYAYGESLLYSVLPHVSTQFERHVTLGRIALLILAVVWFTSAIVRGKIKFRPWKYIHYLIYIALPFGFLHVPNVGSQYMSQRAVQAYFYTLLVGFALFTMLRVRSLFNIDCSAYIVTRQQQIADDVHMVMLIPTAHRMTPQRGQYVYLKMGFISEDHPFSVTQYDPETGAITLAYRTYGAYTLDMAARLQVGGQVYLSGPHGAFMTEVAASQKPRVYIGGGIGVTPFIDDVLRPRDDTEQWLFYANRSRLSAPFTQQLRDKLGSRLVQVYSRDQNAKLTPGLEVGRLRREIFSKYLSNPAQYEYYLCGTEAMLDTVSQELLAIGVAPSDIHQEAFSW